MKITRRATLGMMAALAAPSILRAQSAGVQHVGVMLPFSGIASVEGLQTIKGIELAVEEFNASGRYPKTIEILREDDESNASKGVAAVRKLIENHEVPFIVGTYASAVALAATRVAREYKVPMLTGGSTGAAVTDDNPPGDPWFFRAFPDSNDQGEHTAQDIIRVLGKKKIAIMHDRTPYGTSLAEQVQRVVAAEPGGEIVFVDNYATGEQDFFPVLTRLRQIAPEAVYIGGWAADGAMMVRQAREVGLDTQFVGSGSMITDDFIRLAGPASEGFAVATLYEPGTTNPHGKAYGERHLARWGENGNTMTGLGYDSMSIGLEAMARVGEPDSAKIQQMIYKGMADFPIVTGPGEQYAKFTEKGGVLYRMMMSRVVNGKREIIVG